MKTILKIIRFTKKLVSTLLVGTGFFCYEVKLDKTIDDHARLTFTGIIPEEKEDQYVKMAGEQTDVELQYTDENGKARLCFMATLKAAYKGEHIQGVEVSGGNYAEINLNYARLEQVNFSHCIVQNSYLIGTRFQQCDCRGSDFRGSVMMDADFRDCDLEEAWFDQVYAVRDLMNEARGVIFGVHGVCFQRANLTNASFRDAQVAGDFTYAELDGVDFTGADLTGSRMLRRDAERTALSEEQRSSICWVEE